MNSTDISHLVDKAAEEFSKKSVKDRLTVAVWCLEQISRVMMQASSSHDEIAAGAAVLIIVKEWFDNQTKEMLQ